MRLDMRLGFGETHQYKLSKFPDNSMKFELKTSGTVTKVVTTLRTNEDIIALLLISDVLERKGFKPELYITYMMYQQDDRLFDVDESFGLRVISKLLNSLCFSKIRIFHPHSDKVEFINNVEIVNNTSFIKQVFSNLKITPEEAPVWVIPDSGAFKSQFKLIEKLNYPQFITCMKSRVHATGEITTVVNTENLQGKDCVIFDDICLGGRTFTNIAEELRKKNCGKLYLVVSHGIFNKGIVNLLGYFEKIYTTDSICTLEETEKLKIFKL